METIFVSIFAILIGAAICFGGYRVFLVLLPIWGFFAGLWVGAEATSLLFGGGFLATITGWLVGFFTGLLFAVLSYLFYAVGVALVAGGIGWWLVTGLMGSFGFDSSILLFIGGIVGALVTAGLTFLLNIQKYVIIFITAVLGANAIALGFMLMLGTVDLATVQAFGNPVRLVLNQSFFWTFFWLAWWGAGLFYQIGSNRVYGFDKEQYEPDWG
jgi:hypothetical protein